MDVYMKIHFNSITNPTFTIKNPPVIPIMGESIDFDFREFIEDKEEADKVEKYKENDIFFAGSVDKYYYKDRVEVHVTLFEEKHFRETYPRLSQLYMMS